MALLKDIKSKNGINLQYHRVASFKIITNSTVSMVVKSYLSKDGRDEELQYLEETRLRFSLMEKDPNDLTPEEAILLNSPEPSYSAYQEARVIYAPYREDMSVTSSYEYLKTLPEFEGALDI